ncbi:unnamed protein product [Citrullus colocynthis]|uniref:Uncharacterized protein n=1 Tax=Citrullus colocynthis TaxID=252529 RepID=A0ABP0YB50_9ROSI
MEAQRIWQNVIPLWRNLEFRVLGYGVDCGVSPSLLWIWLVEIGGQLSGLFFNPSVGMDASCKEWVECTSFGCVLHDESFERLGEEN